MPPDRFTESSTATTVTKNFGPLCRIRIHLQRLISGPARAAATCPCELSSAPVEFSDRRYTVDFPASRNERLYCSRTLFPLREAQFPHPLFRGPCAECGERTQPVGKFRIRFNLATTSSTISVLAPWGQR